MSPLDFDSQFMIIRNTSKTELAKILAVQRMAKDSEDILCVNDGDTGDTWHVDNFTRDAGDTGNTGDTSNDAKDAGSAEIAGIRGMVRGDNYSIPRMAK